MDFDWKTMWDSVREIWLALSADQKRKLGVIAVLAAFLMAIFVPFTLASWSKRRAKKNSSTPGNSIAHVHAAQAVDFWYQESRRYLDSRTALFKTIATGAGLGLAAAGTLLAIADVPRAMLYAAAGLEFLAFAMSTAAQSRWTRIHLEQANEFAKQAAGADPDEIVAFEMIRPRNTKANLDAGFGFRLAWTWMGLGWTFILTALMIVST